MIRTIDPFDLPKELPEHIIYAIDPGVTTGVSVVGFDKPCSPSEIEEWGSGQLSYGGSGNAKDLIEREGGFAEQRICNAIASQIKFASQRAKVYVVIEDFIIRRADSSRDFLSPVRITSGLVQALYKERVKFFFQQPSEAKGTCTDARLDKWGFTIETNKDRHSRDADRHALLLLRKFVENPAKMRFD